MSSSFACVVIYSHNMSECAFFSACVLTSFRAPVRVQSSQNRHCSSLYAAEHPPKLLNVGFSTLTLLFWLSFLFMTSHFQTKYFKYDVQKHPETEGEHANFR